MTCNPELYDDGGFSGGSIDRPAWNRLLADIEAGRRQPVQRRLLAERHRRGSSEGCWGGRRPARPRRCQPAATISSRWTGIVYLAHDEPLNRRVSVKVPHAKLISKPEDAEAYLARLAKSTTGRDSLKRKRNHRERLSNGNPLPGIAQVELLRRLS